VTDLGKTYQQLLRQDCREFLLQLYGREIHQLLHRLLLTGILFHHLGRWGCLARHIVGVLARRIAVLRDKPERHLGHAGRKEAEGSEKGRALVNELVMGRRMVLVGVVGGMANGFGEMGSVGEVGCWFFCL